MSSEGEAIAQDFREALEDMQNVGRQEITNLTIIARENLEHALEISGALVDYIRQAAPHKKLPPLYVLDSIAKNVGTPYTLFFSKKLYQTYMDSYSMVDSITRRKLEEMLKTWKEAVPGSIDTRPVFPPDVVRPIENALIRVRTTALQQNQARMRENPQLYGRGRAMPPQQGVPYRETPTPPGARPPSQPQGYPPQQPPFNHMNGASYHQPPQMPPTQSHLPNTAPLRHTPQPHASGTFQPPPAGGYGQAQQGISIDALKDDIQRLTAAFQAQIAQNPHDLDMQMKLKALMDLQTILQTQNLPQEQLVRVKNQIAGLAVNLRAPPPAQTSTPVPPLNSVAVAPPSISATAPKVSLDSLFGSGALAAIMARNSVPPPAPTPPPAPAPTPARAQIPLPVLPKAEPQKTTPVPSDPLALMNLLRQAGMIPPSAGPTPAPSSTPSNPLPFPLPPSGFPSAMAGVPPPPASLEALTSDIELKASSLKKFRPHLLPLLHEALGVQCSQCGRRFPTTQEGKKKKTAHMDWHFKVNQRSVESEKRGQHRSWLVGEMDWINTREKVDEDYVAQNADGDGSAGGGGGGLTAKAPKMEYIPVPDDPVLAASVCPICQEKFETRWLDDAQEFVWADALKVGDRIYHATCHREAFRDGGVGTAAAPFMGNNNNVKRNATPEPSVLGKRKAEDDLVSALRGKIKTES